MGYDAMTFGNHEFDKGPGALASFLSGNGSAVDPSGKYNFQAPDFPLVSSNVDVSKESKLRPFMKKQTHLRQGKRKSRHLSIHSA